MSLTYSENACSAQGFLFWSVAKEGYDVEDFAEQFFNSKFCKKSVDYKYGRFHNELFLDVIIEACNGEITPVLTSSGKEYSPEISNDIGYIYRMICEITEKDSKEVFKIFPFKKVKSICSRDLSYEEIITEITKTYF